jgi:hypothetical protein
MTKLVFVAYALLSSLGAINALEGEKVNEHNRADDVKNAQVKGERAGTLSGAVRKLQYGNNGYDYGRGGVDPSFPYGGGAGTGGYAYGYGNGNRNRNRNSRSGSSSGKGSSGKGKGSKSMKMMMSGSGKGSSSNDGNGGNNGRADDYYFVEEYYQYDDEYYMPGGGPGGVGGDFLDFYGGPCVHVVEKIHFEFPPPTDIFAPNGGVFGDIGGTYIWALVTVKGFGTLDGVCTRTWPDFDGVGGDGLCNFVLTDPETGDQLLFGGKLDSITPGGALAVTGGSGSVAGVFGDIYVHAEVDGGNDVLDFTEEYYADGLLGIIHCPQKHGSYDHYEYPVYPYY